jgi:hypothetical protein
MCRERSSVMRLRNEAFDKAMFLKLLALEFYY